jgi:hypothetical protein
VESPRFQELGASEKLKAGMLSAALGAVKRLQGKGGPLEAGVEYFHEPSDDFHWNESFYFNFTDPREKLGGWTRVGMLPNQDGDTGAMMLYAGGSRILATLQEGRVTVDRDGLSIGPLSYRRSEPLRKWRLLFEGDMLDIGDSRALPPLDLAGLVMSKVEVELDFEGMAPCFDFDDSDARAQADMLVSAKTRLGDLRMVSRVASEHYEQTGRVTGRLRFDDREIEFNGSGHRDHSWGPRDWAAPRLWTWLTCQFGDELAFNLSRVAIASVDVFNGFITRGGRNYPFRRAALETEFEEDGLTQRSLRFRVEDTGGKIVEVAADVRTVIPLRLESDGHTTLVNEALAEYRLGDRVGYGIAEYLHQLG